MALEPPGPRLCLYTHELKRHWPVVICNTNRLFREMRPSDAPRPGITFGDGEWCSVYMQRVVKAGIKSNWGCTTQAG